MAKAKSLNNLEAIGDLIGSYVGMAEGLDEPRYMQQVIERAHKKSANAFDIAVAATAGAGHLQHVYEFGTIGITPGQPKYNPLGQQARLWVHQLKGKGGSQDIGYTFRPAVNRNPVPTTKSTGVASKYLRKISKRKYVFYNKAWVMETGQTVEIHAKRGNYLFVPFYGKPPTNTENKRGFVMYNTKSLGPIQQVPGKTTKGTFTTFWMKWWGSQGAKIMESQMRAKVNRDIRYAELRAAKKAAKEAPKPASLVNVNGAVASARAQAKREFERNSHESRS